MNELELQKQSLNISEIVDDLVICDDETLKTTFEIIKAIRKHKSIVMEYWKTAKESAKKAYQDISRKEKEMLYTCEKSEKILKYRILDYTTEQKKKQKILIKQAETEREKQIKNLLSESNELKKQANYKQSELKLTEAEKLKRINLSFDFNSNNKITTQKRWKCRITNNKLVPVFFNGIEIRETNTKKLLEIRRHSPKVKIPGVEFYQEENLIIRSV